jgi:hypothetical protein
VCKSRDLRRWLLLRLLLSGRLVGLRPQLLLGRQLLPGRLLLGGVRGVAWLLVLLHLRVFGVAQEGRVCVTALADSTLQSQAGGRRQLRASAPLAAAAAAQQQLLQ